MSPLEIAWGFVTTPRPIKQSGTVLSSTSSPTRTPLEALEDALRPALHRTPCFIEFSGGRDSSLVLAVALNLARREGLPEPVAFTQRFPGVEEADEDAWQELVVRHLKVTAWERVSITDELDLIGPVAAASLRRYGIVWPPLAHTKGDVLRRAAGGSLVTGEGGDEVFGPRRLSPLKAVRSRSVPMNRRTMRYVALAVAPASLRRRVMRGAYERNLAITWLRDEPLASLVDALALEFAQEPYDWRKALRRHLHTPVLARGMATISELANDAGVSTYNPLIDPNFIAALCQAGGWRGFMNRTDVLTCLFSDLLPDEVLRRTSKATFGGSAFHTYSRAFASEWDGGGIDPTLVDVAALRAAWQAEAPHGMTYALLQSCWLAAQPVGTPPSVI